MSRKTIYQNNSCYLCDSENLERLEGTVRDYPSLHVLKCKDCGLCFLDSFDHIDDVYYENSHMLSEAHLSIEKWRKENLSQNQKRASSLKSVALNKKILDFGCGEGGFLKEIKKISSKCTGVEKSNILRDNIISTYKIEICPTIDDVTDEYDIITLFHVIEHLKEPIETLVQLKRILSSNGQIIVETPNVNDALLSLYKSKAFTNFTYWGCHLYIFSHSTLAKVARKAGYKINYIKQLQRYPLANHLYWLSEGKPNGHKIWNNLDDHRLNKSYEAVLANLGICDTLLMSISKE